MSPLQNLYVFGNFLINPFIGRNCFFLHSLQLQETLSFLRPLNSHSDLQFLSLHFLL